MYALHALHPVRDPVYAMRNAVHGLSTRGHVRVERGQ
jgi:hypothetical protein